MPLAFWGCLFFHWRSFSLVNGRKLQYCAFMHGFGLPGVTGFVEYGASIASDFDDDWRHFGEVACINTSRLTRLRFIKNLMPPRVSP
jgi:hypothetical protein